MVCSLSYSSVLKAPPIESHCLHSPGRFFVAGQMKVILGYIVTNFDLKLGGDGKRPSNIYFAFNILPNPYARVLCRRREN